MISIFSAVHLPIGASQGGSEPVFGRQSNRRWLLIANHAELKMAPRSSNGVVNERSKLRSVVADSAQF